MIHHVSIEVSDLERSGAFYDAVLATLGWRRHSVRGHAMGWGIHRPVFFISSQGEPVAGNSRVCFAASGMAAVRAAWEAGVDAGGVDDGRPDGRPQFGPAYYCAYLRDLDGYRLEIAVAHE